MQQSKKSTLRIATLVFVFCLLGRIPHAWIPFSQQCLAPAYANAAEEGDAVKEEPTWEQPVERIPDPIEPINRAFFTFNDKLYFWALKPAAKVYSWCIPTDFRTAFQDAFSNSLFPVHFVNALLQGKWTKSGKEIARFAINTTLGCGGMFDIAKLKFNITTSQEDFGQTLGFYGMKPIMYLDLPFLGPSSLRDAVGTTGDAFMDPVYWAGLGWMEYLGYESGRFFNHESLRIGEYEDLKSWAVDPYSALRDAYAQMRAKQIRE